MSKENAQSVSWFGMFLQELLHAGIYKRSQGWVTRQITFLVLAVGFCVGAWQMFQYNHWGMLQGLGDSAPQTMKFAAPAVFCIVGIWLAFRLVNYAPFADFLIAVQAEMNKVSWPSQRELVRSSIVVILMLFSLAVVIFLCDQVLSAALTALGVVK